MRKLSGLATLLCATGCAGVESGEIRARVDELKTEAFSGFGVLYDPKRDSEATLKHNAPVALYAEMESGRREVMLELSMPESPIEPVARYWERETAEWIEGHVSAGRLEIRTDGTLDLRLNVYVQQQPRTVRATVTFVSSEEGVGCGGTVGAAPRVWQWPADRTRAAPPQGSIRPEPPTDPRPRPGSGSNVAVTIVDRDRDGTVGCGSDASQWEDSGCGSQGSDWESSGCGGDDGGTSGCSGDSGAGTGSGAGCDGDAGGLDGCSDSGCDGDLAVMAPWPALQRFWARFGPCVLAGALNRVLRRRRRSQ